MSEVVAIRPPTLTCAPWPNSTPLPLMIQTLPLAVRLPLMADGVVPCTRFKVIAALLGCWKLTLLPAPTPKLCQLISAFWLDWLMSVLELDGLLIVAEPDATDPPVGRPCAETLPGGNAIAKASAILPPTAVNLRPVLEALPLIT